MRGARQGDGAIRDPTGPAGAEMADSASGWQCRPCGSQCRSRWLLLTASLLLAGPAHAVRPDEMLADPALEARAREIGQELRCLVCRNQSIDDSDADLAHDLRVLVRERIKAGDTNDQVIAYIRSRYGDFVLLRPPFEIGTVLLWVGPALILLLGGFGGRRGSTARGRRDGRADAAALSPDERRRLAAVLGEEQHEHRGRDRAGRPDLAGGRRCCCCRCWRASTGRGRARPTIWRSIATSSPRSSATWRAAC